MGVSSAQARLRELLCACAPGNVPVLVIAAHPDDETVGASTVIAAAGSVTVVHVTDGAPRDMADARRQGFATREAYADARRREALQALAIAGVPVANVVQLGFVDQETSFHLPRLVSAISELLKGKTEWIVLTHPYEGGHPDHDSTALAVHAAVALLPADNRSALCEFTSYHAAKSGVETLEFLDRDGNDGDTSLVVLSPEQCARKKRMMAAYETQRETLAQFAVSCERFRPAPKYFFTRAPHIGRLHYENHDWKMTGEWWRALARDALHALDIEEPL